MPHLSELQRQHNDVIFACLSDEPEQTIRSFVAKNDKNMGFRVGVDEEARMWKSWMEAAGLQSIPTAFIVDKTGEIAWIGNTSDLEEPLEQILEGQYNPQSAIIALRFGKARKEAFREDNERLDRGNRLVEEVEKLIAEEKAAEAVALMDRAIQNEPGERVWYGHMKLQALVADPMLADQALEYGIELAAQVAAKPHHGQPTHVELLHIASTLIRNATPDARCSDLAIVIVKEAETAAHWEKVTGDEHQADLQVRLNGTLAYVYESKGEFDKATAHAHRAIQACRDALPPLGHDEARFRQEMTSAAKEYETLLAELKKQAPTTPSR